MMSQNLLKYSLLTFVGVLLLSLLSSCSKSSSGGGQGASSALKESNLEGHYVAKFSSLNSSVSGFTDGYAKIQVMENHLSVALSIKNSPALTYHSQSIYSSSECPSEVNDANRDGFVDSLELYAAIGGALIPLDGDLGTQDAGIEDAPLSDAQGDYHYFQETELSQLMADLILADVNMEDNLIKWNSTDSLHLDDKIIIIHGVSEAVYLPGSVRSFGSHSDRSSLPIACAKIVRVGTEEDSSFDQSEEIPSNQVKYEDL